MPTYVNVVYADKTEYNFQFSHKGNALRFVEDLPEGAVANFIGDEK